MRKYFSINLQNVKINNQDYYNEMIVNGVQYSMSEDVPFGTFEYKLSYPDNIIGKAFRFKTDGNIVYDEEFIEIDPPIQEPSQLDRIEANVDYLMMLNEVTA